MTTTLYLIRHGTNNLVGHTIAGRTPGVELNPQGRAQAAAVALWLSKRTIQHLYSSPLERTRQTAEPSSVKLNLPVGILEGMLEVNYGEWTGRTLEYLNTLESFKKWNTFRSGGQIPGGETMLQVQSRCVAAVESLRRAHPGEHIAIFSHGDPIRTTLMYYLGIPLDFLFRLEVSPGSISIIEISEWAPRVSAINFVPPDTEGPQS